MAWRSCSCPCSGGELRSLISVPSQMYLKLAPTAFVPGCVCASCGFACVHCCLASALHSGCLMLIVCRSVLQRYVQSVRRQHAGRAVPVVRYPGASLHRQDGGDIFEDGVRAPHAPPMLADVEYAPVPVNLDSAERLENRQPAPPQPPIGPPIQGPASPPRRRPMSPTVLNEVSWRLCRRMGMSANRKAEPASEPQGRD